MKLSNLIIIFVLAQLVNFSAIASPCLDASSCRGMITMSGKKIPYYRNYPLSGPNVSVSKAIVVIHGNGRTASSYFESIVQAARIAEGRYRSRATSSTIIVAPHFRFKSDMDNAEASKSLYWDNGWKAGNDAKNKQISSYQVIDHILGRLNDRNRFPKLKKITMVGHSAGGQFVQRYAAGSKKPSSLRSSLGIKFIVANPSSYMYLNDKRRVPGTSNFSLPFVVIPFPPFVAPHPKFPKVKEDDESDDNSKRNMFCPDSYHKYKYGMNGRNRYMNKSSKSTTRSQYKKRSVVYFLGTDDDVWDEDLAISCSAMVQGKNRYQRGANFKKFMDKFYNGHKHSFKKAQGIGHTSRGMFKSDEGVKLLFY
ncbi:MAG: hypothetical protein ISR65_09475 [Bacteriovoracaceae bacterium]|nr:hypothetical protein [Bacteriovoracaceae bacterium]